MKNWIDLAGWDEDEGDVNLNIFEVFHKDEIDLQQQDQSMFHFQKSMHVCYLKISFVVKDDVSFIQGERDFDPNGTQVSCCVLRAYDSQTA